MARGMIPTDLFHIQWVSDARLSPDGRLVAFTATRLDKEADDYRAAIWPGPADGSTPPTGTAEIRAHGELTINTFMVSAGSWSVRGANVSLVGMAFDGSLP